MSGGHETITVGEAITGAPLEVTRQTIADFAEASLDFNPLHFDEGFMEGHFGKTQFGGPMWGFEVDLEAPLHPCIKDNRQRSGRSAAGLAVFDHVRGRVAAELARP